MKTYTLAALAVFLLPQAVFGGAYGSAILIISNAKIQYSDTESGAYTDVTAGTEVSVDSTSLGVTNVASIFGATTVVESGSYGPTDTPNTAQAFTTSGTDTAPGEDTFSAVAPFSTSVFGRADQLSSGALIGGLTQNTIAEFESTNGGFGFAQSSTNGIAGFAVNQTGWYRLVFDASVSLTVSDGAIASSTLALTINGNDTTLDSIISDISTSISGTKTYTFTDTGITSAAVKLNQFSNSSLSLGQETRVEILPEPTSALIFCSLGAVALVRRRRS